MKIAVYGASGMIGSRVVAEALGRRHDVIGITRSGGPLPVGVRAVQGDAGDAEFARRIAAEADVVVSAIGPSRTGGNPREFLAQLRTLAETLNGTRLLVVGGAGSLIVDDRPLLQHPDFPVIYHDEAVIGAEALEYMRTLDADADWTFISPAPVIQPGERTGVYKLGTDYPVGDSVSAEDYAVALLDEIDSPAHRRQRFTLAN